MKASVRVGSSAGSADDSAAPLEFGEPANSRGFREPAWTLPAIHLASSDLDGEGHHLLGHTGRPVLPTTRG
jgi:hypothetical protein